MGEMGIQQGVLQITFQISQDHPETSFSRILDNICYTVENGKDLLEVIPDGPVPIHGFVKALARLLTLGVVSQ